MTSACSACIHELVEGGQSGGVPCPLCRSQLHSGDLYDAVTEEEAAEARQAASIQGDYGSKVTLKCIWRSAGCDVHHHHLDFLLTNGNS